MHYRRLLRLSPNVEILFLQRDDVQLHDLSIAHSSYGEFLSEKRYRIGSRRAYAL